MRRRRTGGSSAGSSLRYAAARAGGAEGAADRHRRRQRFQGHFQYGSGTPSRQTLRATFDRFAALGLRTQITEFDLRIPLPATPEKLETQASNYRDVVSVCVETPACDVVVVWGLHDGNSWVPSTFPGWGDALLFDAAFNPKRAYRVLNDYLAGR